MFAGIAVGAALFGGVAAFALNSMADTGGDSSNVAVTSSTGASPSDTQEPAPSPTISRSRGPRRHTPTQNPRETTRPAQETSAPSPSPTPRTQSPSPTPTPTPKPLRKVPNVVGLNEQEAYATLKKAGLSIKTKISDDLDTGSCSRVLSQSPGAGQVLREGKPVTLLVDKAIACPGDGGEAGTPSPVPSPSAS
jgi:serine/threonine-protein kinase